jgi:glycosyltransferase involved in cell wall biosynthesis
VSKIKNIHLIYDAHELYPEQAIFEKDKREFYTKVETEFIKYTHLVITVNKSIAKEMSKRYNIKEPKVILNALDPSSSFDINKKYDYFRDKLPIKQTQKIVLFQGGYSPNRNLHLLVQSAKFIKNKNVVIVMMGFGDYEKELQQIAKSDKILDKKVFFFPAVDQSVLLEYSASADVGIIPYPHIDLNSYYCTPNKLFEFIQAGLPIIANDSPELNRFIKGNNIGFTKKIDNEKDIADMIDTYFKQSSDYKKNILKVRSKISWSVEENAFIEMMKGVL